MGTIVFFQTREPVLQEPTPSSSPEVPSEPAPTEAAAPIVERIIGLWATPKEHFWSGSVAPPNASRVESVPHGPPVAPQGGKSRPILGSTREASVATQLVRQLAIAFGVANPLDKSFATGGFMERVVAGATLLATGSNRSQGPPPPPDVQGTLDGGDQTTAATLILDAGDAGTNSTFVLSGGNQDAEL